MDQYTFVIQARLGSTRLPGKVLLRFGESTILGHLIKELIEAGLKREQIIVATTAREIDDLIEDYVEKLGISTVRGDEENVLSRYQIAARKVSTPNIVRLTADNPLPDFDLITYCLNQHEKVNSDMTSTREIDADQRVIRYAPKGASIDILKKSSLLDINHELCTPFEKEHVIPYFYRNYNVFVVKDYQSNREELSIDTIDDYHRVCNYYQKNIKRCCS